MVLAERVSKGALSDDYDYKVYGRNTVDLLFKSLAEAKAEYVKLKESLPDFTVSEPDLNNSKKAYLVGLADFHTVDGVKKCLHQKYGETLQLHGENKSCLEILSIDPCNNNDRVFRAKIQMSEQVMNIISNSLGNKLRIGFSSCTVYPIHPHRRCRKCQGHGHIKSECKESKPTCAFCGGEHYTDQCQFRNQEDKKMCINCFKSDEFKDQCRSHSADSGDCPVFKHFRSSGKK